MELENHVWIALFLPLAAVVAITLFARKDARLSAMFSIVAIVLAFLVSVWLFVALPPFEVRATWLAVGNLKIDFGVKFDGLSSLMLLVVTGVGSAIHIYSYGYMRGDRGVSRYFASLSLFTFSMLGIVLANNFLQLFIFWELVGLSSYLLIGFWYERASAADAAKKAFLTNRLGDYGFMLGILLVWATLGSLNFVELETKLKTNPQALGALASVVGLLIFCGAMGKSAQFPLHVWLPDAMEGPTPVSALIHAATMVAAGVYLLCRVFFLYQVPPEWPAALAFLQGLSALDFIAWIGGFTALLAAVIAVQQNDIKRILAYSTLSQLGTMVMAVGLGGPAPAMYHLTTHAFFKALLFLGAGSVILALHHEQDIWKMGGLWQKMPVTFWTFLVGTLALSGVWPFSGFFSKEVLLTTAYHHSVALFVLATFVAVLTTFYMFRLVFVAFLGPARSQAHDHAHESPAVMTLPLVALAAASTLAGFWGIDDFLGRQFGVKHAVEGSPAALFAGLGAVLFGFSFAYGLYRHALKDPLPERLGALARLMRNKFYFDEFYEWLIARTQDALATVADWFDRWIVAGLAVRGVHGTTEFFGRALRLLQTGNLQTYAFLFVAGLALVLYWMLK